MSSVLHVGADVKITAAQTAALSNNTKYLTYVNAVDKALKAFETINEWADLISALTKLSRVFQANAKFNFDIPKPVMVAKRLSQCLHPALPHGVHLKALETYRQLFDILGPNKLPQLLYLFRVNLFSLMETCATEVKFELLNIFEQYLMPLGARIKPALPSFLTAVLLSLEEGSDCYSRSLALLTNIKSGVGDEAFFGCLWKATLKSPSIRLAALIFVNICFDKRKTMENQNYLVGDNVEHMIMALCAIADDNGSTLVQRHLLNFLSLAFPLNSDYLMKAHFVQILQHCIFVLLRRDMSLNRRLYQWLTNRSSDSSATTQSSEDVTNTAFFRIYSLPLIREAVEEYLKFDIVENMNNKEKHEGTKDYQVQFTEVRVCRLLLYFLDRPELGNLILEETLYTLLGYASHHANVTEKDSHEAKRVVEFGKSFNLLLKSLDPGFVWCYLGQRFERLMIEHQDGELEMFNERDPIELKLFPRIMKFCIQNVEPAHADIRRIHAPNTCTRVISVIAATGLDGADNFVLEQLLDAVLAMILEIWHSALSSEEESFTDDAKKTECLQTPLQGQNGGLSVDGVINGDTAIELFLESCVQLLAKVSSWFCEERTEGRYRVYIAACNLLKECIDFPWWRFDSFKRCGVPCGVSARSISDECPDWVLKLCNLILLSASNFNERNEKCQDDIMFDRNEFLACSQAIRLLIYVFVRSREYMKRKLPNFSEEAQFLSSNVEKKDGVVLPGLLLCPQQLKTISRKDIFVKAAQFIWQILSNEKTFQQHCEAAELLCLLHSREIEEPSSEVEDLILQDLTGNDDINNVKAAKTFGKLWTFRRSIENNELYKGLPAKPFNRVVMVFLGVLANKNSNHGNRAFRVFAYTWFAEVAKCNDLPGILQVLAVMLLNPTTARISIQYLSMRHRLNRNELLAVPAGICAITLLSDNGQHFLHHLCEDVSDSVANPGRRLSEAFTLLQEARYSDIAPSWLQEIKSRLLQGGDNDATVDILVESSAVRTHRRIVSDIPIFDGDNESLVSVESLESAIVETVQFLVNYVCVMEEMGNGEEKRKSKEILFYNNPSEDTFEESVGASLCNESDEMNVLKPAETQCSSSILRRISETAVPTIIKTFRKGHRRQDSLQESIFAMTAQELKLFDSSDIPRLNAAGDEKQPLCHELHAHMLLYTESGKAVDLARAENVFCTLIALMSLHNKCINSQALISCMVSSGTASLPSSPDCFGATQILDLLSRHMRALVGQDFWVQTNEENDTTSDAAKNRHVTFLELFMNAALHYLRSYYLNSPTAAVSDDDLKTAWECKMAALDFLNELLTQLIKMIQEKQSYALVAYIYGLLQRTKMQKCILSLLLTLVYNIRTDLIQNAPLSADILEFNEGVFASREIFDDLINSYQNSLLDLAATVVHLELDIKNGFKKFSDQVHDSFQHRSLLREPPVPMVELKLFLSTVMNALKRQPSRHERWQSFVVDVLPFLDRSLPTFCMHVVEQLRKNMESAITAAGQPSDFDHLSDFSYIPKVVLPKDGSFYPTNYLIGAFETLTTLVHFCLLDNSAQPPTEAMTTSTSQLSTAGQGLTFSSSVSSKLSAIPGTKGATELISNLVKAFSSSDTSSMSITRMKYVDQNDGCWSQARREILNALPTTLITVYEVWSLVYKGKEPASNASEIKRLILEFLTPIARDHQQLFLIASSYVWLRSASVSGECCIARGKSEISFDYCDAQMDIASLLLELEDFPFDTLVSAVTDIIKDCGGKSGKQAAGSPVEKGGFAVEASLLELLHGCLKILPHDILHKCWPSLQTLFTTSPIMNLPPRAIFLEFIMLVDFIRFSGYGLCLDDRQEARTIQDACQKLTEAINIIIGWQLEQTTWLKRTLVVKHDSGLKSQDTSPVYDFETTPTSLPVSETSSTRDSTSSLAPLKLSSLDRRCATAISLGSFSEKKASSISRSSIKDSVGYKRDPTFSIQAISLLAENLAELIDLICKSEDTDRLLPTLQAVWNNVLPYLKSKCARNARFFLAGSRFLASMSTFNCMRAVWRKSTFDLFLDPSFFKMDVQALKQWLIIIDKLMTHDKTSFKELLVRISTTQNSALSSLMTSKEAEYEMRAQALKRLAFTILSSPLDRYQSQLPSILERLTENLKLSQVPYVHAQVFLCYRVLLLRLEPSSLVSMWPVMDAELVSVLLQIEDQLSGILNSLDDLKSDRDDHWMQLYLAACKLLETLCTLPSGYIPKYQVCHWAFVGSVKTGSSECFKPFAERISALLTNKYGQLTANERKLMSASLSNVKTLTSLSELRPFFLALATQNEISLSSSSGNVGQENQLRGAEFMRGSMSYKNAVSHLEHSLHVDFAEHWQL